MQTLFCRAVTSDRLRLDGLLFEPEAKSETAVLHIHGMSGNFYENLFVDTMAHAYTEAGYALLSVNTRGHDFMADVEIKQEREDYRRIGQAFERFEDCVHDLDAWLDVLRSKGYRRLVVSGHSLGSVKTVYYLYKRRPPDVQAVVIASPLDMLGMMRVERERENFERDLTDARRLVAEGKGDTLLPHKIWNCHYKSAQGYLNFFTDGAATDVFPILRAGEFPELEGLQIPVLAFFGGTDNTVVHTPAQDLEILARHLKHPGSKALLIGDAPHSYFGYEREMAETITDWLKEVL